METIYYVTRIFNTSTQLTETCSKLGVKALEQKWKPRIFFKIILYKIKKTKYNLAVTNWKIKETNP